MSPAALLAVWCVLIVAASLLGGLIPLAVRLTHRRLELLISFVSGVMLGAALLHLLPHAWLERAAWTRQAVGHDLIMPVTGWLTAGFLAMFFIERFFCFHHHDEPAGPGAAPTGIRHGHQLTWTGAAVGLTLHSLVAGAALGASVQAHAHRAAPDEAAGWSAGLGTLLAILLHKPFDAMTLGTLMAAGGRSPRARHAANLAFGLVVPLGAVLFVAGTDPTAASPLVSAALAFSAGTFLCISLSDLLPELQFHQHDRVKLSAALLLGIGVAWGAATLEARSHEEEEPPPSSLDADRPMAMLIGPCDTERPPSRSFSGPAEGRPRSVHA